MVADAMRIKAAASMIATNIFVGITGAKGRTREETEACEAMERQAAEGIPARGQVPLGMSVTVALHEAAQPAFRAYQQQVVKNARALAAGLSERGFRLVSGGTDNHLLLMDLRKTEITGKVAQETLDLARITANRNTVPFETRSPFVTSGLRMGTPTVTTRGMREPEMDEIAALIARGLSHVGDAGALAKVAEETTALCKRFPLYHH